MGRSFVAGVLGFGLTIVVATASMAATQVPVLGNEGVSPSSVPSASEGQPRGVGPGVDALLVPDLATAQTLVGANGRVESGNVHAYVATYSPESDAGYYAITRDRGTSIAAAARARLSTMPGSNSSATNTPSSRQTILVFSKFTTAQIDESLATLTTNIESAKITASFYYEPENDSIRLNMRKAQVNSGFSIPITDVPIRLVDGEVKDTTYRDNMPVPFRGGGAIYNLDRARCTSGIPAYNSAGTRGYFTAAHCFGLSSYVWASSSLAGGSNTGKVSHRYGTDTVDAEFVSGKTYTGRIYTGLNLSVSKPIVGSYFPAAGAGNRLCFSGSTTGVQCGNSVVTYSGNYCGATGCNSDLLALRGGVAAEGGDSGGPLYANFGDTVMVSGIIRGVTDPPIGQSTTFAVDWRKIASRYDATLMLG